MKKQFLFFFVVALPVVSFSQLGTRDNPASTTGVWQNSDYGYQMILMLQPDGTGEFDGEPIRYEIRGNELIMNVDGYAVNYLCSFSGGSMTLSEGDLDSPVRFTRVGAGEGELTSSDSRPPEPAGNDKKVYSKENNPLLGRWVYQDETLEFVDESLCRYLNQNYQYTVDESKLTLYTTQGPVSMMYSIIADNQLMLTGNGKSVTYLRPGSTGEATSGRPSANSGAIAQELVGKWCYIKVSYTNSGGISSDRCITLNADGTYEYYGESSMSTNTNTFWAGTSSQSQDNGTWSYDGKYIHYVSVNSGAGKYVLQKQNHPKNGDPMIVLDGETYVTFYQKAPW